jgi:hypothetical protein
MIRLLNTIVHVESRNRLVRARKISATPASPACVATRMCSTYLDFGAASCVYALARRNEQTSHCTSSCRTAQYLDLRPALHALLEGTRHGARRMLQPGLPGGRRRRRGLLGGRGRSTRLRQCSAGSIAAFRHSEVKEYWGASINGQRDTAFGQRQHRYVVSGAGVLVRIMRKDPQQELPARR